jgi:hypothetical protein
MECIKNIALTIREMNSWDPEMEVQESIQRDNLLMLYHQFTNVISVDNRPPPATDLIISHEDALLLTQIFSLLDELSEKSKTSLSKEEKENLKAQVHDILDECKRFPWAKSNLEKSRDNFVKAQATLEDSGVRTERSDSISSTHSSSSTQSSTPSTSYSAPESESSENEISREIHKGFTSYITGGYVLSDPLLAENLVNELSDYLVENFLNQDTDIPSDYNNLEESQKANYFQSNGSIIYEDLKQPFKLDNIKEDSRFENLPDSLSKLKPAELGKVVSASIVVAAQKHYGTGPVTEDKKQSVERVINNACTHRPPASIWGRSTFTAAMQDTILPSIKNISPTKDTEPVIKARQNLN